ncbi:MAG: sugar ABC transporter ATP-binding protein [Moorella humiferrea]|nr:sugar ABC transporter ATP-binding protein [Moorella humiferrea]
MLQAQHISKHFGGVTALKDASLSLAPGEIRALLGANGSGKSTLVKVLGGLVAPDSGTILLDGKPLAINSPGDARRHGIAVAYQDLSLVPRLSVAENILLGREPCRRAGFVDTRKVRARAEELLARLQVDASPDALAGDLEPAAQSLVEVAKALAWDPRILILDEVTASLHHDQVQHLFSLLREMSEKGLAILFVSHRFDEVFSLCQTAMILRGGESVASVQLDQVDEADVVYYMTGTRPEKSRVVTAREEKETRREVILAVSNLQVPPRVRGVTLTARAGEIIGLAGLQGQGQAEFLRAIYGQIPFSGGRVEYNGASVAFTSPREAVRRGIGFISGDREREGILPVRSVTENLFLARLAKKNLGTILNPSSLQEEAGRQIEQLGIVAGSTAHPASSLSGGNQQKLIIGRWLAVQPRLLLLDDPTKGVDVNARREIHNLLRQMAASGTAVLIASSDNEELLAIAERIYVFYEGEIVAILQGSEKTEEALVAAMLGMKQTRPEEGA